MNVAKLLLAFINSAAPIVGRSASAKPQNAIAAPLIATNPNMANRADGLQENCAPKKNRPTAPTNSAKSRRDDAGYKLMVLSSVDASETRCLPSADVANRA